MSSAKKAKANLPKNWIVVNSTTFSDRVYYFNVRTGKSSWKEPDEIQNESKPGKLNQKHKLSDGNEKDDISTEKLAGPDTPTMSKPSDRRILRAKRILEPPKAKETPQMKEMRLKIMEKSKSKQSQNEKSKSKNLITENQKERAARLNRNVKTSPKAVSKISGAKSTPSSQQQATYGSSMSVALKSTSKTLSGVSRSPKASASQSEQRSNSSRASSLSQVNKLKKNTAQKRLDNLKRNLNDERKKIEPMINVKVARRMSDIVGESKTSETSFDQNCEKILERKILKSPTELLPSISRNAESRHKALRARLTTNPVSSNAGITESNEQSEQVAARARKMIKRNKRIPRSGKAVVVKEEVATADKSLAENQRGDSFWEEMEWEPIEEQKVIFEVQEVRTQLLTDQDTQPNLPDCSMNGLDISQASENADKRTLYIVVDTNVYLSNLKTVNELLEYSEKSSARYEPVVVVPWTVLQELDYIKDNKSQKKSSQLQNSARIAIDLLFKYFTSKHPRLKGQTASDATLNKLKYQIESPDDEILQSCLQIRELGCTVVLLSNDKNLCNKAMIHNIQTYGRHESIHEMLSQSKEETLKVNSQIIENKEVVADSLEAEISDEIYSEAKAIMKHFFSTIVSKEMENLYGKNWNEHTIIKPPWSINDVLKCTTKHWIAAISDVFLRQAESLIAKLSSMFLNAPKYGQSLSYVKDVLDVCNDLVQMVKSKDYQDLLEKTWYSMKELTETCKRKQRELRGNRNHNEALIPVENNNFNEEQRANKAFVYFDQIWTFTNNFCGVAADLAGIPHSISYKILNPPLPTEMVIQMQPDVVFNLNQLIHALRTVLSDDEYLTADHPLLKALYHILINYLPNSGELDDRGSLDMDDLLCCLRVKKECLKTGLLQLQELCYQFCRIADFRSSTTNISIN